MKSVIDKNDASGRSLRVSRIRKPRSHIIVINYASSSAIYDLEWQWNTMRTFANRLKDKLPRVCLNDKSHAQGRN